MKPSSVWIVQHDESPDNTVLGVFGSLAEADEFAEGVKARFANGVIYSEYAIGYRYDDGTAQYRD